jgi:hypothetical protein
MQDHFQEQNGGICDGYLGDPMCIMLWKGLVEQYLGELWPYRYHP